MSVSYAVDFALSSSWAPTRRCWWRAPARGASARSRPGLAARTSGRRSAWRRWCSPVKAAGWVYTGLGGPATLHALHAPHDSQAARRRGDGLFRVQHGARRHRHRAVDQAVDHACLEPELPVERAELLLRRRRRGHRGGGRRARRLLDGAAHGRPGLSDLPDLQGLHGPHPGSAAARAAGLRPASRDHRSAGAGDRRQGSDGPEPHPPRAGLRGGPRQGARHARDRNPGRQNRGAASRHRQAGGARAHPVQAGSAHAGGVPEDPHPPAGRRGNHQRRALSLSGRPVDPEPSRAVGRKGISHRPQGPTRSRSARASCRWSTISTRRCRNGRTTSR